MKIIIFTLVPVIILAILNNKGILPSTPYYILLVIISIIGSIFFWYRFASIIMRDNMNYQEYNWYFNPNATTNTSTTVTSDPWLSLKMPGTCVGQYCCSDGLTYDTSLNQCVATSTVSESFVNNVLTKQQPGKYKADVNLGSIQPTMTKSFINY
jgi:hypothetical protein